MNRVTQVSFSFTKGGAARAANDFQNAATVVTNAQSDYLVADRVPVKKLQIFRWLVWQLFRALEYLLIRFLYRNTNVKCSTNIFSSPVLLEGITSFEKNNDTIFHFHWIGNSALSCRHFSKIPHGSVITLHDEWIFLGVRHYDTTSFEGKNSGVLFLNRAAVWLDKRVFKKKMDVLRSRTDLFYTAPTEWLCERAVSAGITDRHRIHLIPNAVDVDFFRPKSTVERITARAEFGLSPEHFVICYAAGKGSENILKGFDLLLNLLEHIEDTWPEERLKKVALVVFGGAEIPKDRFSFQVIDFGKLAERSDVRNVFCICDSYLHLARREAFGLVPVEAQACGLPVICFNNTGTAELLLDGTTGFLCDRFDPHEISEKLCYLMDLKYSKREQISRSARLNAVDKYSNDVLVSNYRSLLRKVTE